MRRLGLILPAIAAMLAIRAQPVTDISLNFSTKQFENPKALEELKRGQWFRLVIYHVNLNLYKVTLDKVDSTKTSDIKMPDFSGFSLDNLAKLVAALSPLGTLQMTVSSSAKSSDSQYKKISDTILARMDSERIYLQRMYDAVRDLKFQIDQLYLDVFKYQLSARTETDNSPDHGVLQAVAFDFTGKLKQIMQMREDLFTLQRMVSENNESYISFSEPRKKAIEDRGLKDNDKKIKDSYSELLSGINKLSDAINADKVNQLLTAVVLLDNNKDFTYTSLPQQFNGDVGILKITIEPRGDSLLLQKYATEIHFPKPQRLYVGVGPSFYFSGMYDAAFSTKTIVNATDTTYSLVSEGQKKNEFGMAVLLRYGWKFGDNCAVGAHFTFGPAVSISNKIKPRVILGGGLSAGTKNMLVFDGGFIAGYSDRLSKVFSTNDSYKTLPSQPTVSTLQISWFISLGYLYRF